MRRPARISGGPASLKQTEMTMPDIEQWRPVVGSDGWYDVSNLGRVRSWRNPGKRRRLEPRMMSPGIDGGYAKTRMLGATVKVYRLVAAAFIGPCPPGHEVRHLDGDGSNDRLSNLRYGTKSENMADRTRHGGHPAQRLTYDCVSDIRRRSEAGETGTALAAEYGVSRSTISRVVLGQRYGDAPGPIAPRIVSRKD